MMVRIEVAEDPNDVQRGVEVIKSAWGVSDLTTIFKDLLVAINFNGGLVLVAKDGGNVIGVSFALVGYKGSRRYLYSHMTGVEPSRRNEDIGYELKKRQREWALSRGFDLIAWTFDPLQGLNSNFNLRKLGAIARVYRRNHYGEMRDSLNSGLPSDRVIAEWFIRTVHVQGRLNNESRAYGQLRSATITKAMDGYVVLQDIDLSLTDDEILIEIPQDLGELRRKDMDAALRWRLLSRELYEHYFSRGYALVDFMRVNGRNFQVASKRLPTGIEPASIFSLE